MKIQSLFISLVIIGLIAISCNKISKSSDIKIKTEVDSASYALGIAFGSNIKNQFDDIDADVLAQGIKDVYAGEEKHFTPEEANMYLQAYSRKSFEKMKEKNLAKGKEFLENNKNEADIKVTESGLQYKVIEDGVGDSPMETDKVKVHYKGTFIDGTVFDSSYERGQPATFEANRVIKGWTEAITMMKPGAKWMIYIPSELAYGERGAGQRIGPNEVLIFEIELLEIVK